MPATKNKKIQNATPKEYNGIEFKSILEAKVCKILTEDGFSPQYEKHTYLLWDSFVPKKVPFYTKNRFKKKDYRIVKMSKYTVRDNRPPAGITYTPDFYFEYNGKCIIVEVKGFENEVFPYKFKMFRKYIENLEDVDKYEIWEIFTLAQLKELINNLKQENEETS